ncbi:hypothetical protein MKW98_024733 [Papaver atlanticum]|uniref:Shortage in chiasmata 1 n=1 Tax=Papaver atlanticum TaxID=357466 RepID=A0AAD4XRA1_9MAGN|nr:hypothetical protein MKW98_024733 [Papaver atlanticum]
MRTRFLNSDYFSHSSEKTLKDTINFLPLPVPQISNTFVDTKSEVEAENFCFDSVVDIDFEIETFQIDKPLSFFLNEVLPHRIDDVPDRDFLSSNSNSYFDRSDFDEEDQRNSQSQTDLNQFQQRGNEVSGEEKDKVNFKIIPFETPELDFFLEDPVGVLEHGDDLVLPDRVSEMEMTLDLCAAIPYPCTLSESIYLAEDITLDFQIDEKKSYVVEDACLIQDRNYPSTRNYPLWEVNEFELEVHPSPSMDDEFHVLLQSIGFQQWTESDKQLAQGDDLMRYIETASLEFLLKPHPLEQAIEPQPAVLDMFLEMDFICRYKSSDIQENPMVTLEVSDVEYFQVITPVHFQEYQILDLNCNQLMEVFFSSQTENQPDSCDSMFSENNPYKQLYESIISHELALVDDSFKSFPIPVLSDDKERLSPYTTMQEILADLKPHSPSASDGIYLDWHLLLQDRWNSDWNVMEDIDTYCVSSTLDSTDAGLVIFDFVFSEETPDGSLTFQDSEKLKEPFGGFGSTILVEDAGQKPVMSKPGTSEKVPTLSDSMSNFNELSFFLNPRKSIVKQNTEPAVQDTTSYIYDMQKRSKQEEGNIRLMPFQNVDANVQKFEGHVDIVPLKEDSIPVNSYEPASSKANSSFTLPLKEGSIPVHSYEPASSKANSSFMLPTSDIPESKKKMPSFSDFIVIVNTQNFDKEMLISRRSSYQKILVMEKSGVQVIEREIDYPVDLILSAAMCLVWYDCKSIGNKAINTTEALSFVPLYVENIATNVLTSLSFAFSDCALVFEGDNRYLTAIMESSDGLYAAAASLGIGLQLFCSYSPELTDEIVMSCIDYSLRLNKGQYPKMPDTETLAESFLTRFPSIHPLSAHAILSSGGILVEFLECSSDHRIQVIEKCHVPNQSVSLFSSLCSFGEHEGSKSGTTDCSSVSPASESNSRLRTETQRKRQKCVSDPQTLDIPMDGNFLLEPLIQSDDMNLKPPRVPKPFQSLISSKHQKADESVMSGYQPADTIFGQKQSLNAFSTNNSEWNQIFTSSMSTDLKGEVIDLTESPTVGEDFFSSADTLNFSKVPSRGNDHAIGNSSVARRLSFGLNDFPDFPSSADMNSESDMWASVKDHKRRLEDIDSIVDPLSFNTGREPFQEQNLSTPSSNAHGLSKENNSRYYGSKPFCNAIKSSRHQQGSPWTKEFLSKIKEKSRIHQKSLQCQTILHDHEYPGSREKIAKRKSPSILDFYKYDGGSKPKKTTNQKWQKRLIHQPVSVSKNEKASSPGLRSWTPIDKRAKQTLSFTKNGNETQSKLVWGDGDDQLLRKRYRKET